MGQPDSKEFPICAKGFELRFFFRAMFATAILSSFGTASEAQECTTVSGASSCPVTCSAKCEGSGIFYSANTDACEAAFSRQKGDIDPPNCKQIKMPRSVSACVAEERTFAPESKFNDDEVLAQFNADFFANLPDCAASTTALGNMYQCLDEEVNDILANIDEFSGLDADPNDDDSLKRAFCSLGEERLLGINSQAREVKKQKSALDSEIIDVGLCRTKYETWVNNQETFCATYKNPDITPVVCQRAANILKKGIEQQLAEALKQSNQVNLLSQGLDKDLNAVAIIAISYPVFECTPTDSE